MTIFFSSFLLGALIGVFCVFSSSFALSAKSAPGTWSCETLSSRQILSTPAKWTTLNCSATSVFDSLPIGPLRINVVSAPMKLGGTAAGGRQFTARAVTAQGINPISLAPLSRIVKHAQQQEKAKNAKNPKKILSCINGGYFWELNNKHFFDNVCFFKSRADAEKNVSLAHPINGVGDGLTVRDGKVLSTNCGCIGYNRPATFDLDSFSIAVQHAHDPPPPGVRNAYSAGPNLVSAHANGTTYVDVPADDENINRFERSAATAAGFRAADQALLMVTVDGSDGCSVLNDQCGLDSWDLAVFMKDVLNATQAMSNDQGGSTTMSVAGSGAKDDIVSCNSFPKSCPSGEREIFNALCLFYED